MDWKEFVGRVVILLNCLNDPQFQPAKSVQSEPKLLFDEVSSSLKAIEASESVGTIQVKIEVS
jgi:hypothetical protein